MVGEILGEALVIALVGAACFGVAGICILIGAGATVATIQKFKELFE